MMIISPSYFSVPILPNFLSPANLMQINRGERAMTRHTRLAVNFPHEIEASTGKMELPLLRPGEFMLSAFDFLEYVKHLGIEGFRSIVT
jgi:hypothetical protein